MKQLLVVLVSLFLIGCNNTNTDIDKILQAKAVVRTMVNFPDTLSFYEFDTKVAGNAVTLKFSCENAFGVPTTHTTTITVK
jgi:hypothetical protein